KSKFLVAYIVPNAEFNKESIQDFLKERLPNYMVPGFYVALDELPLTSNGKVDLKKLPNISEQDITSNYAAPTTQLEEKLAAIWQEVLGIERIGITDNFFELGGHSLIVIQVINKINQQLGRDISFKDFFLNPTIEKIDKLLEEKTFARIQIAPLSDSYPLTLSQTQYWLMNQTGDVLKAYDITNTFKIHGNIDVEIFEEAFNLLIKRHEILRTYFKVNPSGVVNQYVGKEDVYYKINNHDFTNKKPSQVLELLDKVTNEDFDLEKLPLIKNHLLKVDQNEYVFFISLYHIIADGWSLDIIMKEVLDFYKQLKNKEEITLPELKIQYKDYVLWLIENEQEKKFEIAQNYWIEKFKGEIPVINITTVKTRPAIKTYNGKNLEYKFSEDFYRAFKLFNNKHDVTSFITLNAVLNILLFTKSMQDDIIIGTPVSGRNHPELENLVGLFTNVLALRTKINTDSPFVAFLELHKKTILESFDNQIYPFYSLIEKLKLKRDLSRSGLFDVMMNLNTVNNNVEIDPFDEFEIEAFNTVNDTSQFDLNFVFTEFDALNLIIQFNTDVFEDIEIEIMMKDFDKIMMKIFENENILIKDLEVTNKDISKRNEHKLNKFLKRQS
ncbi:condensation domain-containing protein, partial [Flavobacterium sp. FlaQc-51]|uniref:condensation domain-containing protein n=1 Tax=Flavobacterium sp. FlaQc-51 TaxID=3374184 RepID=UPI0037575977